MRHPGATYLKARTVCHTISWCSIMNNTMGLFVFAALIYFQVSLEPTHDLHLHASQIERGSLVKIAEGSTTLDD